MAPEIVRLERAGVCGCGELVAAGERAGYTAPQEIVVCLSCLSASWGEPVRGEAVRRVDGLLPADWTADEAVIVATLRALRAQSAAMPSAPRPTVLHVPTEWSSQPPAPSPVAGRELPSPEPLITLPRRKVPSQRLPEADVSEPTDDSRPTDETAPTDATGPTTTQATPLETAPTQPTAPHPTTLETAPTQPTAALPALVVALTPPETDTRRSRHDAAAVEDLRMPVSAPRRRAGLFSRMLTVRTFRAQQGQPRVTKSHAAVRDLLESATAKGVLSLHNRRVPGRRGGIEHIAVGATGIYVIDALHFKNASIEVRPAGDADAGSDLVVGGRIMTAAVRAVALRAEVLRLILVAAGLPDVPVTGALCFVDGLMPLSTASLQVGAVQVVRPSGLTALVAGSGAFGEADRETLREFLAERLPAST